MDLLETNVQHLYPSNRPHPKWVDLQQKKILNKCGTDTLKVWTLNLVNPIQLNMLCMHSSGVIHK